MESIKQIEIRTTRLPLSDVRECYASKITHTQVAERACRSYLEGLDSERFVVVMLDIRNAPIGFAEVARGSAEQCAVDIREVFRPAVVLNASAIIVAHNHPSGDPSPSMNDMVLTERILLAGEILGIPVLDHIIIADNRSMSFASVGLIRGK